MISASSATLLHYPPYINVQVSTLHLQVSKLRTSWTGEEKFTSTEVGLSCIGSCIRSYLLMVQCKLSKIRQCLGKALVEARNGNHMLALLLFTVYITAVFKRSVQDRSSAECCSNTRRSARESSKSDLFGKRALVSQL